MRGVELADVLPHAFEEITHSRYPIIDGYYTKISPGIDDDSGSPTSFRIGYKACDSGFGNSCLPSGISISAHQPCGKAVGATPDGRKAFTILADGMISPAQGSDTQGVLAAFNSGRKIAQDEYSATLFNMKFSPSALKTDSDMNKLAMVIKTYLTNGGKQIQMSCVSAETLHAAQEDPKAHKEVIVRVAGYSAYFVTLTNMMQNEIIARTEQTKI